jgi:dCTP diphosphatase
MPDDALDRLRNRLREFAAARDWEKFHSPKNLAMAISVEAGELLEQSQWIDDDTGAAGLQERRLPLEHEMADVLLYLIRLADVLDVDLVDAADRKIAINESKYPVDKARGTAKKYSEL